MPELMCSSTQLMQEKLLQLQSLQAGCKSISFHQWEFLIATALQQAATVADLLASDPQLATAFAELVKSELCPGCLYLEFYRKVERELLVLS